MYKYNFIFLLLLFANQAVGQDEILNDSELAQAEFHAAINPLDNNHIVLATMHGFETIEDSYFTIYISRDFGESWETSSFSGIHENHLATGDPVLAFNTLGELFLTHLVLDEDDQILTIVSKSIDGGLTWEEFFVYPFEFTDKPWMRIDTDPNSAYVNNIYLPTVAEDEVHLIVVDQEGTQLEMQVAPDGDQIPSVTTNNKGDVYLSLLKLSDPNELYVQKYSEGGQLFEHSTFVTSFPDYTFNAEDVSFRFNPCPYLAIDNSDGPYKGRLYFTYTASEPMMEKYFDVLLRYSDDEGVTWSDPKVVHSDITAGVQQFYSSIFVNDQGVVLIDWYDRKEHGNGSPNTDFFFGASYDGGETFSEVKLTSEPMDFNNIVTAGFGFGIGDYHQLIATDEVAISFWSDGRTNDGDLNIYFAKIGIDNPMTSIIENSIIKEDIRVSKLFPQPAATEINFELELDTQKELRFEIRNLGGQLVYSKEKAVYNMGKSTMSIPLDLAPNEYILSIYSADGYFTHRKFIVAQ